MAYEIPKNLKYTEKILFNLNFEQAAWIGLFGFLIFTIYFKLPLSFDVRLILSILLALLGLGFAFFNLRPYAQTLLSFLFSPKRMGYFDPKMKAFMEIERIENDSIYLKGGLVKAVIQVQPINFHILSTRQQQAIVSAFKEFLNSLDFPIQIVMRTTALDLEEYLSGLEKHVRETKKNPLLNQFNDFKAFINQYVQENNVQNRKFYIVVPNTPSKVPFQSKENPLNQLEIRIRLCQEKLKNCNLITKRLNTDDLITLYTSYFNSFIEAKNEYQKILTTLSPTL
ncbi:PrgI family protein [Candidatus Woesearchaeota archaeon]|nr:PrgI family protein [Candidatus Aenigmarchaeota archaeon]MBI4147292.1 PrgI family protein [Candidatus Woesearchaeota archaeon]